jgi:hypothetical protein|tara:strand:- start:627 stop:824 length:198 start_codon:yes stop_codon:yes gene_type:complete
MFKPIEVEFLYIYPSVDETMILDKLFAFITLITGKMMDDMNNTNNNDLYPPEKLADDVTIVKSFE